MIQSIDTSRLVGPISEEEFKTHIRPHGYILDHPTVNYARDHHDRTGIQSAGSVFGSDNRSVFIHAGDDKLLSVLRNYVEGRDRKTDSCDTR